MSSPWQRRSADPLVEEPGGARQHARNDACTSARVLGCAQAAYRQSLRRIPELLKRPPDDCTASLSIGGRLGGFNRLYLRCRRSCGRSARAGPYASTTRPQARRPGTGEACLALPLRRTCGHGRASDPGLANAAGKGADVARADLSRRNGGFADRARAAFARQKLSCRVPRSAASGPEGDRQSRVKRLSLT